jgi:hypothetical protein
MHVPVGLLPDLRAGGFDMRLAIGDVVKLVGPDSAIGFGPRERLRQATRVAHIVVGVLVGRGWNLHEFCTRQPQHILLFLALRLGYDDHRAKPHACAHQRQPASRII